MAGEVYEELLKAWRGGRGVDVDYRAACAQAVEDTTDAIALQLGVPRARRPDDVVAILERGAAVDTPAAPARSVLRLIGGKYEALIRVHLGAPDGQPQDEHVVLVVQAEREAGHIAVEVGGIRGAMSNGMGGASTLARTVVTKLIQQLKLGQDASANDLDSLDGARVHYLLR